jgi:hypothetical protein
MMFNPKKLLRKFMSRGEKFWISSILLQGGTSALALNSKKQWFMIPKTTEKQNVDQVTATM